MYLYMYSTYMNSVSKQNKQKSPCELDADLRLLYLVWDYIVVGIYKYTLIYIYMYIVYLNIVYLNYIHDYIYTQYTQLYIYIL